MVKEQPCEFTVEYLQARGEQDDNDEDLDNEGTQLVDNESYVSVEEDRTNLA